MNISNKTDILFTLGEANRNRNDWPNYLQHGFDQNDVPALLELVADQSLHTAPSDSMQIWVPLHAWRTLGQLRNDASVLPLLGLFDELVEDDWALSELPKVIGMIGEAALEPLATYIAEQDHDEFSRVMAVDSLCEIAKHHPALRDEVITHYKHYLHHPDTTVDTLNGLLVCCLLDLDAKELIDEIRALFNQQCVDISCAGDLEEVEIELGFRTERSTPKPTPFDMFGIEERPRPDDNDSVVELIDYYLERYGNDESVLNVSELDGYFAALACAPHTIMPSSWLPGIWGGKQHSPEWEAIKEFRTFNELIMGFYNHVMEEMNEGHYEAMFMTREVDGRTYTIVDEWCEGFLRGINLWGPMPSADVIIMEKALEPIRLFATEGGFDRRKGLDVNEVEHHQQAIEPAVRELYQHFLVQRIQQGHPIVRDEPKIGRNDPCPCGSGKKYKKCCLH